jgi:soluble lytic murein transglycosylase-like protein
VRGLHLYIRGDMRTLIIIILALSMPAAVPVHAGAEAFDQLPGGGAGGFALDLPAPQPVNTEKQALAEQPALPPFPASVEFLVKTEAEHDYDSDTRSPMMEKAPGKGAGGESPKVPYLEMARKESQEQDVDLSLILAVIRKESSFDPKAHNSTGAMGLMQMLPDTARWLGLKDTNKLWTPAVNIKYGVKYLKYLFSEFGEGSLAELNAEDMQRDGIKNTLAAYNAGPGNVRKYKGVPPFKETKNYVQKVTGYFSDYEGMTL